MLSIYARIRAYSHHLLTITMETIEITTEQLNQLQKLYPGIAEHGSRVLVTYALSRQIHQAKIDLNRPQLPNFVGI